MKINQLSCLLVPIIAFSTPVISVPDDDSYGDGNSFLFIRGETTTSPGGFSAVAEPAGSIDPEAAKRAAEKYHLRCVVIPKLVAIFDETEIVTPEEYAVQVNTGAPLAARSPLLKPRARSTCISLTPTGLLQIR